MPLANFSFVPFEEVLSDIKPYDEEIDARIDLVPITANLTASPVFEERPVTGATLTLECEDPPITRTAVEQDGGGTYVFERAVPTHESGMCTVTIEKDGYVPVFVRHISHVYAFVHVCHKGPYLNDI